MRRETTPHSTAVIRTLLVLTLCLCVHTVMNAQQVRTARDFILALKNDANITTTTGSGAVNLTDAMNDLIDDGYVKPYYLDPDQTQVQTKPGIYYISEYDGNKLIVLGMKNINMEGTGSNGAFLQVTPRYAEVMVFINCKSIGISNFTMGHTDTGDCVGDVLLFQNCENVAVNNCRLFGCGVNGLTVKNSKSISAFGTHFYGCHHFGIRLYGTQSALFVNCQVYSNGGGIQVDDVCRDVMFDKCTFNNNKGTLFYCDAPVTVSNCDIEHHYDESTYNVTLEGCNVVMDYRDAEDLPDIEEE